MKGLGRQSQAPFCMISAADSSVTDPVMMITGSSGIYGLYLSQYFHAAHAGHQLIQQNDIDVFRAVS